jgi:hypothetical protein
LWRACHRVLTHGRSCGRAFRFRTVRSFLAAASASSRRNSFSRHFRARSPSGVAGEAGSASSPAFDIDARIVPELACNSATRLTRSLRPFVDTGAPHGVPAIRRAVVFCNEEQANAEPRAGLEGETVSPLAFFWGRDHLSPKEGCGCRWTAEVTAFGVVVRIEHDLSHCPLGSFQRSHSPANANNPPSLTSKQ